MRVKWQASEEYFRIYALEAQFVFSDRQKAFFKALRFAAHWAFGRVELNLALLNQHLATPPRKERVAVSHVLMGYFLPSRGCGTEAIMARVYRQPDERLSTQRQGI